MPAFEELLARRPRLPFAFPFGAYGLPGIFECDPAEPAFLSVLLLLMLLAVFANVIRLGLALDAEVVAALGTPDPVGAHVPRRQLVDVLPFVILIVVVYLSLDHFDGVAALATNDTLVLLEQLIRHLSLQSFVGLISQDRFDLLIMDLTLATWVRTGH